MTFDSMTSGARIVPASTGRALAVANIAVGLATVVRAPTLAGEPWLGVSPKIVARIIRVLGARQVVQGVWTVARNDAEVLIDGAAVDALHALSMVPLALIPGPYRRQAAVSAALAVTSAAVALAASEQ